jgi:nucleoside-diphosphate-sugar epimerase
MKILITGSNGYIAKSLYEGFKNEHEITLISRSDFDLSNSTSVDNFFEDKFFDIVIHTAVKGGSRLSEDSWDIMDSNLIMYYNLLRNKSHFAKFIQFGSGAEFFKNETPYSLSKKVVFNSILEIDNFYSIRIFAAFDENEINTRFIKTNLIKYIKGEDIEIYKDISMDFFYMKDLIILVDHYINNDKLPKSIDCTYEESFKLSEVANMINQLDKNSVEIKILDAGIVNPYVGKFTDLNLNYVGLKKGIKETYNKIKNKYD